MATKTSIQIRLDETLKKDAETVFDNLGIDVPTAIQLFLKKVVATRSIPFSLEERPYTFSKEEEAEILRVAEESHDPANTVAVTRTPQETHQFLDSLKTKP